MPPGRRPELEPFIRHWLTTYGLLVKVPVIAPPTFDGTRDTSVEFQLAIDRTLDQLLAEFAVPVFALPPDDRDGWVGHVLAALDLPPAPPQLGSFLVEQRPNLPILPALPDRPHLAGTNRPERDLRGTRVRRRAPGPGPAGRDLSRLRHVPRAVPGTQPWSATPCRTTSCAS